MLQALTLWGSDAPPLLQPQFVILAEKTDVFLEKALQVSTLKDHHTINFPLSACLTLHFLAIQLTFTRSEPSLHLSQSASCAASAFSSVTVEFVPSHICLTQCLTLFLSARCREGYQGIRCDQFLPKTDSILSDPSKFDQFF